ncbi:ABC transporter permease [Lacisediminihabitans profunda]|uniref:ABC transporter permease n=1 Tax=Lacisediminihabitans profunda TaxID=2594790 RepID=A0A5C8URQ6_9MICO|nr:ABC transporter permease [Lacisediminihabitans profunda]TXN30645.1 ABC transporter permease [Lacisediminihabitans profunda]
MRTAGFVAYRIAGMLVVLLAIAAITYAIFYLLPTNPAQLSCGKPCTPENLARVERFMGYDLPWYQQFWDFLRGIVAGRTYGSGAGAVTCATPCFGYSFQLNTTVTDLIVSRFPVTASIAVGAAAVWLVVGVGSGVASALTRGSAIDRGIMTIAIAGVSAPSYLVGLLAILFFSFTLHLLPSGGYVAFGDDPLQWLGHLALPWFTLAFISGAVYARLTRGQMLEVMGEDYIRTARAKGLTERRVVVRHGLRNALIPVVTIFGLDLGGLLGGAVITEKVFSMQGLGALLIDAVHTLDLQVVVGFTLFAAFLIVLANFAVDLVYGLVDPRVKARV